MPWSELTCPLPPATSTRWVPEFGIPPTPNLAGSVFFETCGSVWCAVTGATFCRLVSWPVYFSLMLSRMKFVLPFVFYYPLDMLRRFACFYWDAEACEYCSLI